MLGLGSSLPAVVLRCCKMRLRGLVCRVDLGKAVKAEGVIKIKPSDTKEMKS